MIIYPTSFLQKLHQNLTPNIDGYIYLLEMPNWFKTVRVKTFHYILCAILIFTKHGKRIYCTDHNLINFVNITIIILMTLNPKVNQ